MTNPPPSALLARVHDTVMGRWYSQLTGQESSTGRRLVIIFALAVLVHVAVKTIRFLSDWLVHKSRANRNPLEFVTQQPKFVTLNRLIANGVIFLLYFFALGLVLDELGINLAAYLAS